MKNLANTDGSSAGGRRSTRFALVGATSTIVDVGLVLLLVDAVGRLVSDLIALLSAALVSRLLHERVTLRGDQVDRWIQRTPVFASVAVLAGVIDVVVFLSLESSPAWVAKLAAVVAAASVRAVAHRAVLFRSVRRDQDRPARRPPVDASARLSVVVPAYREEQRIAETVSTLRRELEPVGPPGTVEIVVVDDGSGDGTADRARQAGADVVISLDQNRGKGAAVRAGVEEASGACIAFTDADLAYPPAQLSRLLDRIETGWDVVIGDRHHSDTRTLKGQSSVRSIGSQLVNIATHVLLLGNYRDTQCGLKAFRRDVAKILLRAGTIDGFAFDIEILHLVERYGLSLTEVPVDVVNSDTSTVRAVRDGLGVGRDIVLIRLRSRGGRYPPITPGDLPPAAGDPQGSGVDEGQRR